jgi:flagellar M-ring protein FliF
MERLKALAMQLLAIWQQLGLNQKITVTASGLLVTGTLVVVVFFTSRTEYVLLWGGLDPKDAGEMVTVLEEQGIPYKAGAGGTSLHVPRSKVDSLRMTLSDSGLPKSRNKGYELFDEKNTISMSDFVQQVNLKRAVQGELARGISARAGVESAQVMVVMPETRLIIDDTRKPTASVMVTLRYEGALKAKGVESIRHFVANAIPGLKHNHVVVVDNYNNTLSANDESGSFSAVSNNRLTAQRNMELYLAGKVRKMLTDVLGPDQVTVMVSADIDHDQVTHRSQRYDPSGSVTNSINKITELSGTAVTNPGGIVGTPSNTNVSDANGTGGGLANNNRDKREETYAMNNSSSETNVVKASGELRRMTATIAVRQAVDAQGLPQPRTPAAMTILTNIVKNALGVDLSANAVRGDEITVDEVIFNRTHVTAAKAEMDSAATTNLIWDLVRNALFVLLGAGALWAFVRLVKGSQDELIQTGVPVGQLLAGTPMMVAPAGAGGMVAPVGAGAMGAPGGSVDTESQIAASANTLDEIEEALKDPSKLSTADIEQLMQRRKEERERRKMLELMAEDDEEENVEVIEEQKQKLIMDFGLGKKQPERVNIEVLRDMIMDDPDAMAVASRRWLGKSGGDKEDEDDS